MRNLKKVIALVAVFAMMVTSVAFAQSYSDVKEDDNYYEAIEMLSKLNILTGDDKDGDGVMDFRPNDTITRAEVAAVICRIQDLNNLSQTTTPFTDVPSSHWASGYVAQAAGQGIINGYGDGNFGPEDDVTYEQAVKMFVETLGYTPFVNANGGYPTGHLTAAQRYGVVDGVVGASAGAKATRGQIAQMAFNAIDTPIMDRSSYGKDEEFTIFDGTNNKEFETLLTRDLKVKKFAGVINANQVTSLTSAESSIDTDKKAEIKVKWDGSYNSNGDLTSYSTDNANYAVKDINKLYDAESGAGELIGYFVDGYAKETDRSGEYDIIAVAANNKNKTAVITLDQFDSADANKIEYYKNDSDNKTTSLTIENGADVLYNGVAYGTVNTTSNNINTLLSDVNVVNDCKYSGQITLIDNNSTNGYDVIKVDVASSAVVKEVKSSGKVTFKETVYNSAKSKSKIELDFDDTLTDRVINLTKDGKQIAYTDLKEWDVLSILYSGDAEYYDVKVLGSNKIDSSITSKSKSDTSADTFEYTIDGKKYDVAVGCYDAKESGKGWSVGTAGVFYIDDYGKIVAYDKNGSTTSSTTNGNYAYIINASVSSDGFNKVVSLQLLDKSGKVYTDDLYERVKFENGKDVVATALGVTDFDDTQTYKIENHESALATALKNRFVTYETNSSDQVKTITFWNGATEDDNTFYLEKADTGYDYDEDNKEITIGSKKYDVDDDTVVFFIKADNATMGANASDLTATATASKTASKVGKISDIGDGGNTKSVAAVFDLEDGVAGAVLLFDATSGISSTTGIAVIDSVGDTTYDGDNTKNVTFFKDGNKMEAAIDPDLNDDDTSKLQKASKGDLYKLALNADGTLITAVKKYAGVSRSEKAGVDGAIVVTDKDSNVDFGPVYDYSSSSNRIRIATLKTPANADKPYDFNNTTSIKAADANVYVFDPNKKSNKIYVGDASDVDYDKDLIDNDGAKAIVKTVGKTEVVAAGKQALGLMDFAVAIYNNDGDVVDVVIYKPYDFGKWTIAE